MCDFIDNPSEGDDSDTFLGSVARILIDTAWEGVAVAFWGLDPLPLVTGCFCWLLYQTPRLS